MSNPNKVGLVFAILLGGWHVAWSILVATGLGQTLYNFILWAHMIHLPVKIGPFDLTASSSSEHHVDRLGHCLGSRSGNSVLAT